MTGILLGISEFLTEHRGKIFWLFFIIIGIFVIGGIFINLFFIDILLGLILIVIGVQRLDEEYHKKSLESERRKTKETMDYMAQWLDASHDYIKLVKNRHEHRIFNLDKKRADLDSKIDIQDNRIEMNHRDIVRKIIEIENRLNELTMSYTRGQEIRSGRKK